MSNAAITSTNNHGDKEIRGLLPVNPFRSLLVHFGMLLGVDDFETVDAYHRGKMWLHSAWLHREGAVWGLRATLTPESNELKISAGLAVDALGREMYLEADACLELARWYEEHQDDPDLAAIVQKEPDGTVRFDAHVLITFKGCLARQVPALNEPCDGSGATTAYSRILETADLLLKPGKAPPWRDSPGSLPYHRLRLLFTLEPPILEEGSVIASDQEVLDARAAILALPVEAQPAAYLSEFRRFAALDQMDMAPAVVEQSDIYALFPSQDPAVLPLADVLEISLQPIDNGWKLIVGSVDNTVRPVHVATSTIQELSCGPQCQCAAASSESEPVPNGNPGESHLISPPVPDAGGPRIDSATVAIEGEIITFNIEQSTLLKASVEARCISVTSFDVRDGWSEEEIQDVRFDFESKEFTVQLRDAPEGNLVRLIVRGTGAFPLLGRNRIPFAGAVGGPPGDKFNGNDFVFMFRIRS